MPKDWTQKEISYLERYATTKTLAELAERFDAEEREVQAKLDDLRLRAKDSPRESRLGNEPMLETYEKGLEALHGGKKDRAEKLLTQVAEECDQPELAERARQYLRAIGVREEAEGVEPEDEFLAAVFEKNRGNHERALELAEKGGRAGKDDRFAYLAASVHATEERLDQAARHLEKAIELNKKNRVHAFHDPDFAPLRKSQDHGRLFRAS